jgi:hypothetical protein
MADYFIKKQSHTSVERMLYMHFIQSAINLLWKAESLHGTLDAIECAGIAIGMKWAAKNIACIRNVLS